MEDVLKEYPELTREDVQAALEYISKILRREIVAPLRGVIVASRKRRV
ncbi:MAG: DUF433 domain-containing protein [Candidatus Bathyarchaeia archaeon]